MESFTMDTTQVKTVIFVADQYGNVEIMDKQEESVGFVADQSNIQVLPIQDEDKDDSEETCAEFEQQKYFEIFGDRDWDLYLENEHALLKQSIGYALFGVPSEVASKENEIGYTSEENKEIKGIYELVVKKKNNFVKDRRNTFLRIIYICWNVKHENRNVVCRTPVFVLKKCVNKENNEFSCDTSCKIFIDRFGRVYDDWKSYLKNNTLPKCLMVCPKNGQYSGIIVDNQPQVLLEHHESPACGLGKKVLKASDAMGIGVTVLTTVGSIAGLVVAAPALGVATLAGSVATAGYVVGRNVYSLTDRAMHQQSIGLGNSESRWCWFGIGTGVVGTAATAASGVVRTMASQGKNISKGAQMSYNILNGANMVGSTAGICVSGYSFYDKYTHKETITPLEIFQFSASLLFFCRSVVDFHTAESLISKAQETSMQNYKDTLRSNKHRKVFAKAVKETERLNGKMQGRAEVISGINNIADKDSFFAGLTRINKDMNTTGARFEITADGNVRINSVHIVDPNEFASMNRTTRTGILNNLPPRQISKTNFIASRVTVNYNLKSLTAAGFITSDIVLSVIRISGNVDSFAMLVANFARETVKKLFLTLHQFLDEIKNRFADFAQTYPCAPVAVGAMQYLINYFKNLADDVEEKIDEFINCVFNKDGTLNTVFLRSLVSSFHSWLDKKLEIFQRNRANASKDVKERSKKMCKKCTGYYYVK